MREWQPDEASHVAESMKKSMSMRIIFYSVILLFLVLFCLWAHKSMIDIRPKVKRPFLGTKALQLIKELEARLTNHVVVLAEDIGPRNVVNPRKLDAACDFIRSFWQDIGYEVSAGSYRVSDIECYNLSVEIHGKSKPDESVIVGAHYDTVSYSPGANDNGSAVAALLELSRLFRGMSIGKTMRFVAFANEEPPYFKTRQMGSLVYAKGCRKRNENITAMVCLETIGYYREAPKTQKYPFPLKWLYPDTGNFIAVVGNLGSKSLVKYFTRSFMEESDFPVECAAAFGFISGIDWSDHWSFWECGYPALMITDTALFRLRVNVE
ncbi:MAG: M28 family peptidase [Deltaproteobacteria bacterium]|nr:M28 family peptidase [Deltaproteobacteria bacterium]